MYVRGEVAKVVVTNRSGAPGHGIHFFDIVS